MREGKAATLEAIIQFIILEIKKLQQGLVFEENQRCDSRSYNVKWTCSNLCIDKTCCFLCFSWESTYSLSTIESGIWKLRTSCYTMRFLRIPHSPGGSRGCNREACVLEIEDINIDEVTSICRQSYTKSFLTVNFSLLLWTFSQRPFVSSMLCLQSLRRSWWKCFLPSRNLPSSMRN